MPRAAAKKPATKKAKKTTAKKDLQVSMKKAKVVKAGAGAGTIWWNPIPLPPLKDRTKRVGSRVGAYRKD